MIRSPAGFDGGDRIKRYLDYYQPSYGVMMLSAGQAFSPASLFAAGEQGVWYDPSDFSTMFQDSAGTTPVTAVGQAVGRILDKSGRGNHATQATPTSRPILRQDATGRYYLEFDGVDDRLVSSTVNPGSVDKVQMFFGVRKNSDALASIIIESSTAYTSFSGTFIVNAPGTNGAANYSIGMRGTSTAFLTATTYTAPITNVLTVTSDISAPNCAIRINGGAGSFSNSGSQGTGNYSSQPLYIGRRAAGGFPLNGWIYGIVVRFSATNLSAATIADNEAWMNGKTGAY